MFTESHILVVFFPFSLKILPCRPPNVMHNGTIWKISLQIANARLKTLLNIICILYIYIYNIYSIFKGRQYYHYSKVFTSIFCLPLFLNAEQSCWIDKRQAAKPLALTWRIKIAMIPIPKDPCIDYLRTLGETWPHSRANVSKYYSLHGSFGNALRGIGQLIMISWLAPCSPCDPPK